MEMLVNPAAIMSNIILEQMLRHPYGATDPSCTIDFFKLYNSLRVRNRWLLTLNISLGTLTLHTACIFGRGCYQAWMINFTDQITCLTEGHVMSHKRPTNPTLGSQLMPLCPSRSVSETFVLEDSS